MAFIYYGQGCAKMYDDFVERLMSQLALRGTEITNESRQPSMTEMDVKHTDEQGRMTIGVDGKNTKVVYTVERTRKEIGKGFAGALTGAGLGSLFGGVLRRDGNIGDRVADAVGGAVAGGAYSGYQGYAESKEVRTNFAQVLAEAMKQVEDDLQYIMQGQAAAVSASQDEAHQKAREKQEAQTQQEQEVSAQLEELYGEVLTLREEVDMAESDGKDVKSARKRVDRAEQLYKEAQSASEKKNYPEMKAKCKAATSMLESARQSLG
jgi:hypothetical protein